MPVHLVDNFLQFVYTSDNLKIYLDVANYEGNKGFYRKYLPIYQRDYTTLTFKEVLN